METIDTEIVENTQPVFDYSVYVLILLQAHEAMLIIITQPSAFRCQYVRSAHHTHNRLNITWPVIVSITLPIFLIPAVAIGFTFFMLGRLYLKSVFLG